MIITHSQTIHGACRVYLCGRGSLEVYITPSDDGTWQVGYELGATAHPMSTDDIILTIKHHLLELAETLAVSPLDLAQVPYEAIAALHAANPCDSRRMPTPKSKTLETAYMATQPNIRRPAADFRTPGETFHRRNHP